MRRVKTKRKRKEKPTRTGKKRSFRELKAFGLWADRADVKEPVEFTKKIRSQMEREKA